MSIGQSDMLRVCAGLIVIQAHALASSHGCDVSVNSAMREGNLGETAVFPWLGVLRVHIHQGDVFKVALTGMVLVKEAFAIANADDVARIPKRIFQEDSRAMFIAKNGAPWFCALLDYMTHPEYEYSTINTIALVELAKGEEPYPMKPICWPPYSFNTSNVLYAIGYTDDNQLLEKTMYSLQFVERKLCEEFYDRAGLMESKMTPTYYICGFAKHNQDNCLWDNGMVMVSNSTKFWTLIGFGVRGPGCAAPARFIDMLPYFPWIESATSGEDYDQKDYRKSAFNEGFKPRGREEDFEGEKPDLTYMIQNYYPYETADIQNQYFTIDRIDKNAINIRNISLPAEEGNCSASMELVFRDEVKVRASGNNGSLVYKLSMYDLFFFNYTCVKLWILPATCEDTATLYYAVRIDNKEGTSFSQYGTTPEHLLQEYPLPKVEVKVETTTKVEDWQPGPHLKVKFLEDEMPYINIENYNIYVKFDFENEAEIHLEVLGPAIPKDRATTTTTPQPDFLRARHKSAYKDFQRGVPKDFQKEVPKEKVKPKVGVRTKPDIESVRVVEPTSTSPGLARSALVSAVAKDGTSMIAIAVEFLIVCFMYYI